MNYVGLTHLPLTSGIYAVRNKVNGKSYVGSARSVRKRASDHRKCLRGRRHVNRHLQAAWTKYGEESFEFVLLQRCTESKLVVREQFWIDISKAADGRFGYNGRPTANSQLGFKATEETKEKHRANMHIRYENPEERERMSQSSKETWADPEVRARKAQEEKDNAANQHFNMMLTADMD